MDRAWCLADRSRCELSHARVRHPQTIGKDERFHRTLKLEVISTRDYWDDHAQVQEAFDRWRPIYNHQRPHDALDGDVPADRYRASTRAMPTRIEPIDYPDHLWVRKVSERGQIMFQKQRIRIGSAFRGRHVGIEATDTDGVFDVCLLPIQKRPHDHPVTMNGNRYPCPRTTVTDLPGPYTHRGDKQRITFSVQVLTSHCRYR